MKGGEEVLRYSSVLCPDYGLQQNNYLSQTPGGPLMSRTVVNFSPLLTSLHLRPHIADFYVNITTIILKKSTIKGAKVMSHRWWEN